MKILFALAAVSLLAGCGWEAVHQATSAPVVANVCKNLDQAACEAKKTECHWKADDAKCGKGA